MFDGKQRADDPEHDSLTGDCNLFRKLRNLEEEKPHRSKILQANIIRDGIHAYKIYDFPQSIHRLRERAVNLEDALFKLCQSIQKNSEDCTTKMSWNVDSAYKAALSPDSGLCNFYRSIRHGTIVKEKRLHLEESARIGDRKEKDGPTQGEDFPREDIVAAAIHFLTINRAVKTDRKGRTIVGTFKHLRNGKDIDIKQKEQSLRKLHSLEKDELLIRKGILPGVACTVRQSAVKTRKMSGESNSLKSNYGLSKKNLSQKHRCLSSVEVSTRNKSSKRSPSLSIIDAIFEDKFSEEDTSVSSVETITIREISGDVNTTRQIHVVAKKRALAEEDSLSTSSFDTTETVLVPTASPSKVGVAITDRTSAGDDSSSADDYNSLYSSGRRRDVNSRRVSKEEGSSSSRDDTYRRYDSSEVYGRRKESDIENRKGTTKVGTFTHLRNGKDIDIKQKDQSLRKLHSLEKDEVLITKRILPGVACTVRQSAVKTRNMSEESNSLKSNYGLSKKRLSQKHRCLSSVEADTRERWSERSHSLSTIDAFPEEQFSEEDASLSTVGTITIQEISAKVNTTRQIHVVDKKERMARDDSLSTTSCDTTETVLVESGSPCEVGAAITERTSTRDDFSSADDYNSLYSSGRRRDVNPRRVSKEEGSSSSWDYRYRRYDSSEVYGRRKEGDIEAARNVHNRVKSVRRSLLSSQKYAKSDVDTLDEIKRRTKKQKQDETKKHIYITCKRDMQKRLRAATGTYKPKGKFEQEAYDYTYDTSADTYCEEGLSTEEFYIKRSNEMYKRMQKVKQSYASKKDPSEAEIDSIDDIISRNDSSKKEHASKQVHVQGPDDVQEGFVHMKNRETLFRDGLFKEEYRSYQPTLQIKADFSEESDKLHNAKFEMASSSMNTNDKLGRDDLFEKDISGNSIDLLNKEELMKEDHLINKIYVTCSKNLYRKMQYINECGLLNRYGKKAEPENDSGMYITENNKLFKKINIISADGFTPDEDASAIVDEYAENLYLTCQNSLFKKIHHQGEGDLENIKELLKRKGKEEAEESVKRNILPQERKHTIYIYLHEKEKDKDPDKNKNDWVIYKRIEDRKVKVELLEDMQTMNKLDVTAVDSVYKETEEALMRSVLEPAKRMMRPNMEATEESLMKNVMELQEKTTKSNIKKTMKKVAKYGIPGVLAMVVLPFLVMEYLKLPGASALLEAELIGARAGL
ncbi:hypothetical protein C922_05802, partial [Plasmodium inui San Antonio 1]